ncbi:MAG: Macrolide export protein MacA [Pseudomonadota bacterium]|jgi:RND family efflux transporter MFP subunit
MKSWKHWAVLALVAVALALGLMRALGKREQQQQAAQQAAAQARVPAELELSARDHYQASQVELVRTLPFTGTLKAVRSAAVKARVAGELRDLEVREGDAVRAGQLLARIDATEALARVQQAEQQALASEAQQAIAQRQHDNNQALVQQGFISATALQNSQASLDAARANLKAAQAAVAIARKSLADTELRAPIGGQVSARLAQNGERVPIDARVLEIVDAGAMEIEATLPPADALELRVGQMAEWSVEGMAQAAPARVARISPSVQAGSRSLLAYLGVPAQPGLRQGLFVQGRIQIGSVKTVAVPLSALRQDKPRPYLQLLRDGKVVHLGVEPGVQGRAGDEDMVAIAGLPEGSLVLRASAGVLADGTPAHAAQTVTPAATPAAAGGR